MCCHFNLQVKQSSLCSPFPKVDTLAFANFSHALVVPPNGGTGLMEVPVDYTKQPLSTDSAYRDQVGGGRGCSEFRRTPLKSTQEQKKEKKKTCWC